MSAHEAGHPRLAAQFLAQPSRARFHDRALWQIRLRRDQRMSSVPEWPLLRQRAAQIKDHVLAQLPEYLEQFEANARRHGAEVHYARDAAEHNRIVLELLRARGVTRVVKSKSMLTEECGLNPWLEAHGIEITDTDLGELIVQLRKEPPSHIVLPAIHLRKEDVAETFREQLGAPSLADAEGLTEFARGHLRAKFLAAGAGITGVNFAVAETGGVVVCTNEGNADLGTALPPLHIACMGLEKLIPRAADLGVFLRLLARSATGQAITAYTSHHHGPRPGAELHIVIVDNGRSEVRERTAHRRALRCIRCGACMNTCPVFRRSGGHSYESHVPGPIGSILGPLREPERHASLPHACSMCGSCTAVCPVEIDLHEQLLALRRSQWQREYARANAVPAAGAVAKRWGLRLLARALERADRIRHVFALARWLERRQPRLWRWLWGWGPLGLWSRDREPPRLPERSFHAELARRRAAQPDTRGRSA